MLIDIWIDQRNPFRMATKQPSRPSCVIVGAGPGMGKAIARRFGKNGYKVSLIGRTEETLSSIASKLEAEGISADWFAADAGDETGLKAALDAVKTRNGGCDVLIYNAAVLRADHPLDLSRAEIEAEFSVNVLGAHTCVGVVASNMIEKKRGAILFTGGGLALEPYPEWTSLALGKAALRNYSIALFKELSPKGIHVAVIEICGIVEKGGPFDPDLIAREYYRVATTPKGLVDREIVFQPEGADPYYNDAERQHLATTPPRHVARGRDIQP